MDHDGLLEPSAHAQGKITMRGRIMAGSHRDSHDETGQAVFVGYYPA